MKVLLRNNTFERGKEGTELCREKLDCNTELAKPLLVNKNLGGGVGRGEARLPSECHALGLKVQANQERAYSLRCVSQPHSF